MLQVVNRDVQLTENLDRGADELFSQAPAEDIGLQQYRHPIETEVGGLAGFYQPDGGSYFQGQANQVDQMIVAPQPILVVISATELARRIAKGGRDITVDNWIAKMISKVKEKAAHTRNAYLQGYNNGVLATVNSTYSSGTVVPLVTPSFGGRLLDRLAQYQITDTSYNVLGTVNVIDVQKNGVGTIDTVTVDSNPGFASGYYFIPIGLATGNPISFNGLQYIISPSTSLEYCGISRANSYVQSPAFNANGAFLTLGAVDAFMTRMIQALGTERFKQRNKNVWYTHPAQRMSADILGFAKTFYMANDGKLPSGGYDVAVARNTKWMIAGMAVEEDSMAATDKLYWIDKGTMKRVRYPGSQKFIPGMIEGIFWPRQSGGLWVSEADAMFQDSVNFYSSLPWANGVIYGLGTQPALSN